MRPLVGTIAALALIIGMLTVVDQSNEHEPTSPFYIINTDPVVKPLPPDHWPGQGN
ncbi:hypothetical protein [Nocardia sp. NPDC050175]|uniref:hypothetical protein n=1 Tax=Nocardia sp. NPDC050175 TaxID=3364317 RepID=UPI00378EF4D4